jgi:hypothetical protein
VKNRPGRGSLLPTRGEKDCAEPNPSLSHPALWPLRSL